MIRILRLAATSPLRTAATATSARLVVALTDALTLDHPHLEALAST